MNFSLFKQPDDNECIQDMNLSMGNMADAHDMDVPDIDQIPDSQNNHSVDEISENFEGAPEMVRHPSFLVILLYENHGKFLLK